MVDNCLTHKCGEADIQRRVYLRSDRFTCGTIVRIESDGTIHVQWDGWTERVTTHKHPDELESLSLFLPRR